MPISAFARPASGAVVTTLLAAAGLALAAPAGAATPYASITSADGPLESIALGNDLSCQVKRNASAGGQIYPRGGALADCGTAAAVDGTLYRFDLSNHGGSAAGGMNGTPFAAISQSPVGGTGAAADPFAVTTVVGAGPDVRISERDTYVEGDDFYTGAMTVENTGGAAKTVRLYRGMDCFLDGSDSGYSFHNALTGATGCSKLENDPRSQVEEFVPVGSDPYTYSANDYSTVWQQLGTRAALPNTAVSGQIDNGAALSWEVSVPANGSRTVTYRHRFSAITPINDAAPSVSGSSGVGNVLQAQNGTWRFVNRYEYQWQRCSTAAPTSCVDIPGATSRDYRITAEDQGSSLRAVVTGVSSDRTRTSAETASLAVEAAPADVSSRGADGAPQSTTVERRAGERLRLVDPADGSYVDSLAVPGQGTYVVDDAAGTITFTPEPGFTGDATAVTYALTDGNQNARTATYRARVAAAAPAPAPSDPSTPAPTPSTTAPTTAPAAPTARVCVSRRAFRVHWRVGGSVRRLTVRVAGRATVLKPRTRSKLIDLRGRKSGSVEVRVVAVMRGGERRTAKRTYRLCAYRGDKASRPDTLRLR